MIKLLFEKLRENHLFQFLNAKNVVLLLEEGQTNCFISWWMRNMFYHWKREKKVWFLPAARKTFILFTREEEKVAQPFLFVNVINFTPLLRKYINFFFPWERRTPAHSFRECKWKESVPNLRGNEEENYHFLFCNEKNLYFLLSRKEKLLPSNEEKE